MYHSTMFEDMGLKPTKKTKTGSYTTNAAALQVLRDRSYGNDRACQFLDALLLHREKNKLKQIVQTLIDATNRSDGRFIRRLSRLWLRLVGWFG